MNIIKIDDEFSKLMYEKIARNSTDKKNDTYNLERKRDLLEHIYQIGKGEHLNLSSLK